jgi:uncharacterized protein
MIFTLFQGQQREVETRIDRYCRQIRQCVELTAESLKEYLQSTDREQLGIRVREVHRAESLADDLRREVEVLMFSRAVFPESRGDIMTLLEAMDRVPNHAEATLRMIYHQHITVPAEFHEELIELLNVSTRTVWKLLEAVGELFSNFQKSGFLVGAVDELESEADHVESRLIDRLFAGDRDGFEKLMLREVINHVETISDRAEKASDVLRIIVAERNI